MSDITVRLASTDEAEEIREFLGAHWHPEFSVVQSPALFDFLYRNKQNDVTFVLGVRDGKIIATLGLIVYGSPLQDAFLTLWVSSDPSSGVGLKLLQFVSAQGYRSLSSVGVRPEVLPFYKMLKYTSGRMQHHFILNTSLSSYGIFQGQTVTSPWAEERSVADGWTLNENTDLRKLEGLLAAQENQIHKSADYLSHRYQNHPIYTYRMFEILNPENEAKAVAVARVTKANNASVLRWVDWIGDFDCFGVFSVLTESLLQQEGHEYADLYSAHIPESVLSQSLFVDRYSHDVIVPNYFEPFVAENEDKYFVTTFPAPLLFKGDGDADRPFRLHWEGKT